MEGTIFSLLSGSSAYSVFLCWIFGWLTEHVMSTAWQKVTSMSVTVVENWELLGSNVQSSRKRAKTKCDVEETSKQIVLHLFWSIQCFQKTILNKRIYIYIICLELTRKDKNDSKICQKWIKMFSLLYMIRIRYLNFPLLL